MEKVGFFKKRTQLHSFEHTLQILNRSALSVKRVLNLGFVFPESLQDFFELLHKLQAISSSVPKIIAKLLLSLVIFLQPLELNRDVLDLVLSDIYLLQGH